MDGLMIFGVIVVALVLYVVSIYNNIISLKEGVVNAKTQISVQLDRRGKIFDSLISAVKKYMDYEKSTLKEVIELRTKAINLKGDAFDSKEKQAIEEELSSMISSGAFSSKFQMTMEAYPDLKASENMMQLQEEIVSTENKLSFAKQSFNDSITKYNETIHSVPANMVVAKFPQLKEDFTYWELTDTKVVSEEERRVEF